MFSNCTKAERKSLKRLIVILSVMTLVVPIICGVAISFMNSPIYESYATLIWYSSVRDEMNPDSEKVFPEDTTLDQNLIPTCIEIIKSDAILNNVSDEIQYKTDYKISSGKIREMMSVEHIENTYVIRITVRCEDQVLARDIANNIATEAARKSHSYIPYGKLNVIGLAKVSVHPVNARIRKVSLIIVTGIGLFVCGITDIVLINRKRRKYKSR